MTVDMSISIRLVTCNRLPAFPVHVSRVHSLHRPLLPTTLWLRGQYYRNTSIPMKVAVMLQFSRVAVRIERMHQSIHCVVRASTVSLSWVVSVWNVIAQMEDW